MIGTDSGLRISGQKVRKSRRQRLATARTPLEPRPHAGLAPNCHFRTFCLETRTVGEGEREIGQGWASRPSISFASRSSSRGRADGM
jgi:hypothetical protein